LLWQKCKVENSFISSGYEEPNRVATCGLWVDARGELRQMGFISVYSNMA